MTTLPHIISLGTMERQTGLTSLGVSMVNGFYPASTCEAPHPLFIAHSMSSLEYTIKYRGLYKERGTWAAGMVEEKDLQALCRLFSLAVIDDCDEYTLLRLRQLIAIVTNRMQRVKCPRQIVLLRNPFNVKDLF